MSMRLIMGRSGSGKSHLCKEEILQQLREAPLGSPLILLVPEQMTFQAEYELAKTPNLFGMMRAQVFSFRRLAWKVLQEVGGIARQHINSLGIKMVLRQVIEKQQEHLRIFGRTASQMGFTDQLESLYIEFKRYMVDADSLDQQLQRLSERASDGPEYRLLADKLHDLHLIYLEVENQLRGQYLDSEDYLRLLAERIPLSNYMKEAEIWIDGFHGFTPQEYAVIVALMQSAKRVSLTLTLNRPYSESEQALDLFFPTGTTYLRLQKLAKQTGVSLEEHILDGNTHRFHSEDLAHLESSLGNHSCGKYEIAPSGLQIYQAMNRRAEVEGVAREILDLVRDHGYRWRDIAILIRDVDNYQHLIATIFSTSQIPIFIDQKRTMLHHPLIELLRSVLEVIDHNWQTDAVLRCIKTDLLSPDMSRHQLDRFENYVLEYGINHHRWIDDSSWTIYPRSSRENQDSVQLHEQLEEFKQIRNLIVTPIRNLETSIQAKATVRDICAAIVQFLVDFESLLEKTLNTKTAFDMV